MQKDVKLGLGVGLVLLVLCGFFYVKQREYQREHPQEKKEVKQVLRSSGTGSEERDGEKRILHQLIDEYWDLAEQGDVKEAKQLLLVIQDHLEKLLEAKKLKEMNVHETPPAPPTTQE